MKPLSILLTAFVLGVLGLTWPACGAGAKPSGDDTLNLWYTKPSAQWTDALPIGNGRLGAMVYGGVERERIRLNEDTLWDGYRRNADNPAALQALPQVRGLLFTGKNKEATQLASRTMIGNPRGVRSYQALGDLSIEMIDAPKSVKGYRRRLNLDTAIASVRFQADGVSYTREVFASTPDNCIVIRLSADRPGTINVRMEMSRQKDATTLTEVGFANGLILRGRINCLDDKTGEKRGMKFEGQLLAHSAGWHRDREGRPAYRRKGRLGRPAAGGGHRFPWRRPRKDLPGNPHGRREEAVRRPPSRPRGRASAAFPPCGTQACTDGPRL